MPRSLSATVPTAAAEDLAGNLGLIAVTVGIVVVILLLAGIGLLFRNREGAKPSSASGLPALRTKANVLLVRIDQQLAEAENELGFAVAQFGEETTAEFALAVHKARQLSTAAFRLRKELDDSFPESVTKQREMTLQIVALTETAIAALESQNAAFTGRRSAELEAPGSLAALRKKIEATANRIEPAIATLQRLSEEYRPQVLAEHEKAIAAARKNLHSALESVEAAERELSPSGVNAVSDAVQRAGAQLSGAIALLDSIDTLARELDNAENAVVTLVAATRADLAEARREREAAPDPETGAAIVDAIDQLEKQLAAIATATAPADPIRQLDELNAAIAELDTALASARNQAQRLSHARAALVGTLVSAKSQITATRGFIGAGGRRVGADARTRLSEAERELAVAEAEADPVDALDAARRAVTNARDADALARYDAMASGRG
jgi:hypothetical protein